MNDNLRKPPDIVYSDLLDDVAASKQARSIFSGFF